MNGIISALCSNFRILCGAVSANRLLTVAAMMLLTATIGSSEPLTAQSQTQCDDSRPNSPQSCSVLPLDEPIPAPKPEPKPLSWELRVIEKGLLPNARVREPYEARLQLSVSAGAEFTAIPRLPAGLKLDRNGRISGTPARAGNYSVEIIVLRDNNQGDYVARWRLRVRPTRAPPVQPPSRPKPPSPPTAPTPPAPPPPDPAILAPPGQIYVYRLTAENLKQLDADGQAEVAAQVQAAIDRAKTRAAKDDDRFRAQIQAQALAQAFAQFQPPVQKPAAPAQPATKPASSAQSPTKRANPQKPTLGTRPGTTAKAPLGQPAPATLPAPRKYIETLQSLSEVEFPTESLFRQAVAARLPLASTIQIDQIVAKARKQHAYSKDILQLSWKDVGGWKAVRPIPSWGYRTIYGFMPFWWGQPGTKIGGKALAAGGPTVDFSLYDRIGVVGAQLSPGRGNLWVPGSTGLDWAEMSKFARTAQSHGTQLDLVLEASNWQFLSGISSLQSETALRREIFSRADLAADRAVDQLEIRLNDPARYIRMALLPIWDVDKHVFSGLTVMFTPPAPDSPEFSRFEIYMKRFVARLMLRMKTASRPLTLNIAVSSEFLCDPKPVLPRSGPSLVCKPGPYSFDNIEEWGNWARPGNIPELSSSLADGPGVSPNGARAQPLRFNLIVFIPHPTKETRKRLRATIDVLANRSEFQATQKVELLRSIIPVMFGPGNSTDQADTDPVQNQLAYYDDAFGGAGFWPVPMIESLTGKDMNDQIVDEFFTSGEARGRSVIRDTSAGSYYMSTVLRLLLQTLVLAVGAIILYLTIWGELADFTRLVVVRATFVLATIAAALFVGLLFTDPALANLAQGNEPLVVIGTICIVSIFIYVYKPKIMRP